MAARLPPSFPMRCAGSGGIGRRPSRRGEPGNPVLKSILQPGENWQAAAEGCVVTTLAADPQGQVFYSGSGGPEPLPAAGGPLHCGGRLGEGSGFAFAADGRLLKPQGPRVVSRLSRTAGRADARPGPEHS